MAAINTFDQFFKQMRHKTGLTLRNFCFKHDLDPGNISKLERGIIEPPKSREILERYASYLQIKESSDEWYDFFDLAAAYSGRSPQDLMSDRELVERLPVVFRTLRGQKLSEEKLKELAETIRKA